MKSRPTRPKIKVLEHGKEVAPQESKQYKSFPMPYISFNHTNKKVVISTINTVIYLCVRSQEPKKDKTLACQDNGAEKSRSSVIETSSYIKECDKLLRKMDKIAMDFEFSPT